MDERIGPQGGSAEQPSPRLGWEAAQVEQVIAGSEHAPGAAVDRVAARRADALVALAEAARQRAIAGAGWCRVTCCALCGRVITEDAGSRAAQTGGWTHTTSCPGWPVALLTSPTWCWYAGSAPGAAKLSTPTRSCCGYSPNQPQPGPPSQTDPFPAKRRPARTPPHPPHGVGGLPRMREDPAPA